jgi:hypothetical protein
MKIDIMHPKSLPAILVLTGLAWLVSKIFHSSKMDITETDKNASARPQIHIDMTE